MSTYDTRLAWQPFAPSDVILTLYFMPPRLPLLGRASATTVLLRHRVASYPPQCVRLYSATGSTAPVEAPPPPAPFPHHERLKQTLRTLSALGHGGSRSRVELALRGLEQTDAPVRIAVFGAEILPEILGSDGTWSRMLKEWVSSNKVENTCGGLLLRYGTCFTVLSSRNRLG